MRRASFMDRGFTVIGYRMPMAVAILGGAILAGSVLAGLGGLGFLALVPGAVFRGEVWRLVTWSFVELNMAPFGLLFALAMLVLFLGPTLCYQWGWRRFLATYLGFSALTGALVCLVTLIPGLGPLQAAPWVSAWPVLSAFIVGWAIYNQHAQIVFMFFLPANGRQIVWITGGIIALGAVFNSPFVVLPEAIAFVIALVYFRDPGLWGLWYRLRAGLPGRRRKARPSHLRAVDEADRPRWYH